MIILTRTFFVLLFVAGYLLFKDFCENVVEEPIPQIKFFEEVCAHPEYKCILFAICMRNQVAYFELNCAMLFGTNT